MIVNFKSKKLKRMFQSKKELIKAHGKRIADIALKRLKQLEAIENLSRMPRSAEMHPLKGTRSGEYSSTLVHPFRLILYADKSKTPNEIEEVTIKEITDYH